MARRRGWLKIRDLCDMFWLEKTGRIELPIRNNSDMDDKYESYSIQLDSNWPFGLPDTQSNNMEIKIDKNVPLPSDSRGHFRGEFRIAMEKAGAEMLVGESFEVETGAK